MTIIGLSREWYNLGPVKSKESKKREGKKPDIARVLYDALFFLGLIVMVFSAVYAHVIAMAAGLGLIFLSLFVYELYHKADHERKSKGKTLTASFFVFVVIGVFYVIYLMRAPLSELIRAPIAESWFLYLLLGLLAADLSMIVFHLAKNKKKDSEKKETKEEKDKSQNKNISYIILFLAGLIILGIAAFYRNITTMVLGVLLSLLSLLASKMNKKQEVSLQKVEYKPKRDKKEMPVQKNDINAIRAEQRRIIEEEVKERKIVRELQKRTRQEEALVKRKESGRRKEEMARIRLEKKKRDQERKEMKRLEKAKKRLEMFEEQKKKLKEKEEKILQKSSKDKGKENIENDIYSIKKDIEKKGRYETDIDKLYELLLKYRVIKIETISDIFDIPLEQAEEWAKILENHDLASTRYPAMGGAELRKKK